MVDNPGCAFHHSNTENIMCLCEWPSVEKCLDTGADVELFLTEAICSYILFLNGLPHSPTCTFEHFVQDIWYMIFYSSHIIYLGRFLHLDDLLVNLHVVSFILVMRGQ